MKNCPKCGETLGDNVSSCFKCGYEFNYEKDLLKIKALNELYEYKVVPLVDNKTGVLDTNLLSATLNINASNGWRLKNVITNEIGKNATSIGYGGISAGSNATIDMTILIFERKIKNLDEIAQDVEPRLSVIEENEQLKFEEKSKRNEEKKTSVSKVEDEILAVFKQPGEVISLEEISSILNDKYSTMDLLTYLQRLVDAGKLEKESKNYKLT
jgi:hypothetical protein